MPQNATPTTIEITPAEAGTRLDKALAGHLGDLSRARIQTLIAAGHVAVDGEMVRDAARRLRGGETIRLDRPPPEPAEPRGEAIPLAILYEDADLVVLDKPAGMVVHPAGGHESGTLVNALIAHCGASLSGINGVLRPGIVHRLDKETSGVMVAAKNDHAHRALAAQFADHGRTGPLERRYLALVWGELPRRSGTIDAAIARSSANREKMIVSRAAQARFAITHYDAIETFAAGGRGLASLIACRLETGRTHQIRVHLAHIGHPLLGDPLYGSGFRTREANLPPAARQALERLGRQALHAEMLAFAHPRTGETMRFESPPPPDFAALVAALAEAVAMTDR
ncbi:RluA family pseudouridine synthase [Rhabdaerophilum calidifontis]|uniref:RluA family pseudouridine synthase n=1 Tax=Rhabdaerophilum calidifontis TaxID=2604328 RepID=UPI0012387B39|nr:RluA family pseudouridine synthase [Rhabdaerophilum calidifontis]